MNATRTMTLVLVAGIACPGFLWSQTTVPQGDTESGPGEPATALFSIPKWQPYWRERPAGGLLVAQNDDALAYPGISLPHNQYLSLGNVLIWLHRITGKPAYRDQAAKMARFFKSCLRSVDDRYTWNETTIVIDSEI